MTYTAWSVVFGEQPSAAKWNQLGENDAHFNTKLLQTAYCFRAYDSAGTTLTDNAIVSIALATEVYDYNSNFAASAYTAPVAGVYHFDGVVTVSGALANAIDGQAFIYVDGALAAKGVRNAFTNDGTADVSADLLLAAGGVVTLRARQNSDGNETTATGATETYLSGHLVHAV